MLFQVIEENGQKKIQPLTADTGAGAPVGSIIVVCSNILPSGYLGLGVQYDITNYPVLYALLGTDTTPTASALGLPTLSSGQYAIKATSGLTENQQENVLNTINENLSYSTTEHKTGKKWIDGKTIYRKVVDCGALPNNTSKDVATGIDFTVCNVIKIEGVAKNTSTANTDTIPMPFSNVVTIGTTKTGNVSISTTENFSIYTQSYVTLEYTKTTDN